MTSDLPDDFIRRYLIYTENHESPEQFHMWMAIGIIGACLGRQVSLNWGHFEIYPNNYIVLTAGSADCRKSAAMDIAIALLRQATDTQIFAGKITLEGLYKDMSVRQEADGRVAPVLTNQPCVPLVIHADELGVFVSKQAQQSDLPLDIGTIYTNPAVHTYRTKTAGTSQLVEPSLNLISGTTPAWIQRNLTTEAFEEGFVGRSLFVYAKGPKRRITRHQLTPEEKTLWEAMSEQLEIFSNLRGPFQISQAALDFYDDWYQKRKAPEDEAVTSSGFWGREHVHALKVAMIYCISSGSFPVIGSVHISSAIDTVGEIRKHMSLALRGAGVDDSMKHVALVMNELRKSGAVPMTLAQLTKNLWRSVGSQRVEDAIDDLLRAQRIIAHRPEGSPRVFYMIV
jgi:hypothetical protein